MRIWILETTPDYEPATRHGVYIRPELAANMFYREVASLAQNADKVELSLVLDDGRGNVELKAEARGDTVTLTGEDVEGTEDLDSVDPTHLAELKKVCAEAIRITTGDEKDELTAWAACDKSTGGGWTITRN